MADFIALGVISLVVTAILFARNDKYTTCQNQNLQRNVNPKRKFYVNWENIFAVMAAPIGLFGVWLIIEDAIFWLQHAEWKSRPVSAFLDPSSLRSTNLAGWNKIVDWLLSQPAWLGSVLLSGVLWFVLLSTLNKLSNRR